MQLKLVKNVEVPGGTDRSGVVRTNLVDMFVLTDTRPADRAIPKGAGFRWDPNNQHWWTYDEDAAYTLRQYAHNGLRERWQLAGSEAPAMPRSSTSLPSAGPNPALPQPKGTMVVGTKQQEEFWIAITDGAGHIVLMARAGCGKSFSIVEAAKRALLRDPFLRIGFCAFNKHSAKELQAKVPRSCTAATLHSLGKQAICRAIGNIPINKGKARGLLEGLAQEGDKNAKGKLDRVLAKACLELTSLCKSYLYDGTAEQLDQLIQRHGVELNPASGKNPSRFTSETLKPRVYALVPLLLEECLARLETIDYDDMIWVAVKKGYALAPFDLLFIDEAQDLNLAQQRLAFMLCPEGRIVVVGDPAQSIYGFRGADTRSMPRMTDLLRATPRGVQTYPLTYTRRCPKSHVRLAQALVPDIQAMPEAPEGLVDTITERDFSQRAQNGDLVLCRTNAPLVSAAHQFMRAGKKALIRGKDISGPIRDMIEGFGAATIQELGDMLRSYRRAESQRLDESGASAQTVTNHEDRCDTLEVLMEGCVSLEALREKIDRIFREGEDEPDAIILSSVHGAKGSEADTVFILRPDLMPHPNAIRPDDAEQERNIRYVALTRSKNEMVFVVEKKSNTVPPAPSAAPETPVPQALPQAELEERVCECGVPLSELHTFFGPHLEGHHDELKECPKCGVMGAMHINEGGNKCVFCGEWSDLWPGDPDPGALAEVAGEVFYPAEHGLSPDDYDEAGDAISLADLEDTITITVPSGADRRTRTRALLRAARDLVPYDQGDLIEKIQEALSCL